LKKLGFIFRTHPHSSSQGREGLDALFAVSAYSENITVFFIGDGVTQLVANQNAKDVYCRNYAPAFKLMELYDIEQVYVCLDSIVDNGLSDAEFVLDVVRLNRDEIKEELQRCDAILTF